MSTEGAGTACLVVGAPVMLVGAITVGAGILIQNGVVWCGKQLKEHYISHCTKWDDHNAAMHERGAANAQAFSGKMMRQQKQMALLEADQQLVAPTSDVEQRAAMLAALVEARSALVQVASKEPPITQYMLLTSRLKARLTESRDALPMALLQEATSALGGTTQEIMQALQQLEHAWERVQDMQQRQEYQERQVTRLLHMIARQIQSIEMLSQDLQEKQTVSTQLDAVKQQQAKSYALLDIDPSAALHVAQVAQDTVGKITSAVATQVFEVWSDIHSSIYKQQGILAMLQTMLNEAHVVALVSKQQEGELSARVRTAATEVEALLGGTIEAASARRRSVLLAERVALLQQDVFAVVERKQQHTVAQTIAETLTELGFQPTRSSHSLLQENGDVVRVEAMYTSSPSNRENVSQEDTAIAFDISRECEIAYDLSGYTGDACLVQAESVFAALRAKGVFILNQQMLHELQALPEERVSSALQQEDFHLLPHKNKLQTELVERLHSVLERMGYAQVTTRAASGCVELEAFTGPMGYRVVVTPEGSTEVFKDEIPLDALYELNDPIVSEAQQVVAAFEPMQEESVKPSEATYIERKQQLL